MDSIEFGILKILGHSTEGALAVSEIREHLPLPRPDSSTVRRRLRLLEGLGYIEPLGTSKTNARCYGPTEAGRARLNETGD